MTTKLSYGDYEIDSRGRLIQIDGIEEIAQQAMIRLTIPKGSFVYNPELGSELHTVDLNQCDDSLLYAMVCDALAPITSLEVVSVKRAISEEHDKLSITIESKINGINTMLSLTT